MTAAVTVRIAHVVPDTRSEGPGVRTAIWFQGCTLACPGCCNPELFAPRGGQAMSVDDLVAAVAGATGVTVVGGEPFQQPEGLAALMRGLPTETSRLVFSGYRLEELQARDCVHTASALAHIDVLVDGRFEAGQLDPDRSVVGSANQRVHLLTDRHAASEFEGTRSVELRYRDGALTVVGWPVVAGRPVVVGQAVDDAPTTRGSGHDES